MLVTSSKELPKRSWQGMAGMMAQSQHELNFQVELKIFFLHLSSTTTMY
jgi:hypothetical protein